MKIKRYHLASAPDSAGLQSEVSKLINEGWQPLGPITISQPIEGSRDRFFQVLVQYEGEIRG
jgi:hypothetical protein